ncbi:MAG: tyrosine-type recombinase/integrase [Planctomycetes bacterium]|nr:tyrosine-type recombinase/integrase [Planctomycetota bacterium]MBI3835346.1 tyrosine-type recombinase/integrase [Planctomycetota bacterium]
MKGSEGKSEDDGTSLITYGRSIRKGLHRDFHSLRHSFISNLARSGVHPKIAQDLVGHSDINLTLSRYSHTLVGELADAVDLLPDLTTPELEVEEQRATGTDGASVPYSLLERGTSQPLRPALHCTQSSKSAKYPDSDRALKTRPSRASSHRVAPNCRNAPGGI